MLNCGKLIGAYFKSSDIIICLGFFFFVLSFLNIVHWIASVNQKISSKIYMNKSLPLWHRNCSV